jgi:hypothetical protein
MIVLSEVRVSAQFHNKCFPLSGGGALTEDRLDSGDSDMLLSGITLDDGKIAATRSVGIGSIGESGVNSVMEATGIVVVRVFSAFARSASCTVLAL